MLIATVEQMHALEKKADSLGHSYAKMMEMAGTGIADFIDTRFYMEFEEDADRSIMGLVGSGNNGGDTLIALRELQAKGWITKAYLVKERDADDQLIAEYVEAGGTLVKQTDDPKFTTLKKWCGNTQFLFGWDPRYWRPFTIGGYGQIRIENRQQIRKRPGHSGS